MSEIFGIYNDKLFRNERDGVTYFSLLVSEKVKQRNSFGTIVCSASIPPYNKGVPLSLSGEWVDSPKGKRFKAESVKEEVWDVASAASYLSSGICSGIGYARARAIVSRLGANIFEAILKDDAVEKMSHIPGITIEQATALQTAVKGTIAQRKLFDFVLHYGGYYSVVMKLWKEYGENAKKQLLAEPYVVGMQAGLTFAQCDAIAKDLGVEGIDVQRLKAAALVTMERYTSSGNVYMPEEALYEKMKSVVNDNVFNELSSSMLVPGLYGNDALIIEKDMNNRVYLKRMFYAEKNAAFHLGRLQRAAKPLNYSDSLIEFAEESSGIEYAPQQKESFSLLKQTGVAVVTGGPGTGKTTTINGIIMAYEKMYPDNVVKLCAPTGRAAQRMTESTGREATTVHRLLEYQPYGNDVVYKTEDDPIEADFIVLDEASMLDIELFSIFLGAVKSGTLVLFVGDIHQLPSVGPGDVLHDLIVSGLPVVKLTTVYRQAATSPIVSNANSVNAGVTVLPTSEDFVINHCESAKLVQGDVVEAMKKYFDASNPFATQVLTPTRMGDAGVMALNNVLQKVFNPKSEDTAEMVYGRTTFRVNDKIIMLNNNYAEGYFNGDLGVVKSVCDDGIVVTILGVDFKLTRDLMQDISLAYAMTIHKSQGSEYKNVIIALPYKPATMLQRNLLYTAITRAKENIVIVAENGAMDRAIKTANAGTRNTKLLYKLRKELA